MRYLYTSWHFCIPTYRLHGTRTVRCWCGSQTAGDTSYPRSCPIVSVGSASALQSRPRGLQAAPSHRGPAGGPQRRAAPGGDHVRGAPALCDNDVVWLWRVVWHLVCVGTWCTPGFRGGLWRLPSCPCARDPYPLASVSMVSPLRHVLRG